MKVYFIYFCCILAIFLNVKNLSAGKVYNNDWSKHMWIITPSVILSGYSIYQESNQTGLSQEQIQRLDKSKINRFDRWAIENYSPVASDISDVMMGLCLAAPLVYNIDNNLQSDRLAINLIIGETYLMTWSLVQLSKVSFTRNRPYTYNDDVPMDVRQSKDGRYSFVSGHTAFSFAGAVLVGKIYSDVYPEKNSFWVYAGAITAASTVGALRISAGKHFTTDVLAGALVGTGSALLVTEIHRKSVPQFSVKGVTMRMSILGFYAEF